MGLKHLHRIQSRFARRRGKESKRGAKAEKAKFAKVKQERR